MRRGIGWVSNLETYPDKRFKVAYLSVLDEQKFCAAHPTEGPSLLPFQLPDNTIVVAISYNACFQRTEFVLWNKSWPVIDNFGLEKPIIAISGNTKVTIDSEIQEEMKSWEHQKNS